MPSRPLLATIAAATACISAAGTRADVFFTRNAGAWSNLNDWIQSTGDTPAAWLPESGDLVIILHDFLVDVTTNVGFTVINPGVTLTVTPQSTLYACDAIDVSGSLVLDGGRLIASYTGVGSVKVYGTGHITMSGKQPQLTLNAEDSVVLIESGASLRVDTDPDSIAIIDGDGSLLGMSVGALIEINCTHPSDAITLLLNEATIHGSFTIQKGPDAGMGDAIFYNSGYVVADDAFGQICLARSLSEVLDSDASTCRFARWRCLPSSGHASLRFDLPAPQLRSDISVGGELRINAKVSTVGGLHLIPGGDISVSANCWLEFSPDDCFGGACESPASPLEGAIRFDCPDQF